jgi:hypothetical protein
MPTNLCLPKQGLDLIGAMKVQFSSDPPVMIIIDTLNKTYAGSESNDEDMRNYVGLRRHCVTPSIALS